jgi:hypothetical protein
MQAWSRLGALVGAHARAQVDVERPSGTGASAGYTQVGTGWACLVTSVAEQWTPGVVVAPNVVQKRFVFDQPRDVWAGDVLVYAGARWTVESSSADDTVAPLTRCVAQRAR